MLSVNPWTGEVIGDHPVHDAQEVERRLQRALQAQIVNESSSFAQRAVPVLCLAELLRDRAKDLGALATAEMGKPIAEAVGEVRKCAWVCRYYAEHAERLLAPVPSEAPEAEVHFEALGVVLGVMPWNFPFWQVLRFGVPAWMAGNTLLIKHAPNTQGCAKALESLALEAGFPEGALSTLVIEHERVPGVIHDPRVAAVTVTGSERAGAAVAAEAGRALKKCVLELGGSDPFVVLADADLDAAVAGAVAARIQNNGQSCCAAKRFLVAAEVVEDFTSRLVEAFGQLEVGDPTSPTCRQGPLARQDLVEALLRQVRESVEAGAVLRCGGSVEGLVYAPTVLSEVRPGMPAFDEETFGPVAAVTAFSDLDEAVGLANASDYGLTASVWTTDLELARALAPRLKTGGVFVNRIPGSDPRFPFGGVKKSGYGRELGVFGLREFVNVKTIWVQ